MAMHGLDDMGCNRRPTGRGHHGAGRLMPSSLADSDSTCGPCPPHSRSQTSFKLKISSPAFASVGASPKPTSERPLPTRSGRGWVRYHRPGLDPRLCRECSSQPCHLQTSRNASIRPPFRRVDRLSIQVAGRAAGPGANPVARIMDSGKFVRSRLAPRL